MITIGCFEVEEVSPGRWKVKNTRTTFEHVTYGTETEVREILTKQSAEWERKFAGLDTKKPKVRGSAWRNKPPMKPKEGGD